MHVRLRADQDRVGSTSQSTLTMLDHSMRSLIMTRSDELSIFLRLQILIQSGLNATLGWTTGDSIGTNHKSERTKRESKRTKHDPKRTTCDVLRTARDLTVTRAPCGVSQLLLAREQRNLPAIYQSTIVTGHPSFLDHRRPDGTSRQIGIEVVMGAKPSFCLCYGPTIRARHA